MTKVYDKAKWHIEGGEDEGEVVERFNKTFVFLNEHELLTEEGKELIEIGIDAEICLNDRMLTEEGKVFIEKHIDRLMEVSSSEIMDVMQSLIEDR